jgi:hypothetical protein
MCELFLITRQLCLVSTIIPFQDYRIPHANARFNNTDRARAVVYIGLLPAVPINERYAAEQLQRYRQGQVPSDQWHESSAPQLCEYAFMELGQRLMGILPWESSSTQGSALS